MLSLRRALASAIVLSVGLAGLAAIPGCESAAAQKYAPLADLQPVGLKKLWEKRVTLAPGEKIVNTWRVGDSIYVATSQARLVRINAAVGNMAWEIDLVNKDYKILRPAEVPGSNQVLVVTSGQAYLVDKDTGDIAVQKNLNFAVMTDPIVPGGNVFCVGGANYFYALYLDTLQGHKWVAFSKNDAFVAPPVVQGDSVMLASESGKVFRVSLDKGEWVWRDRKTNGKVVGGLAADARAVYVPCLDGRVYAFDMNNGFGLWDRPVKGDLDQTLMLTRSDVLVPTGDGSLYCLATQDGHVRWESHGVKTIGSIGVGKVWVTTTSGDLEALSLETGEVQATAAVDGATLVTNTGDHTVIMVSRSGIVGAFSSK